MFSAAVVAVWAVFLISLVTGGVEGGRATSGPRHLRTDDDEQRQKPFDGAIVIFGADVLRWRSVRW